MAISKTKKRNYSRGRQHSLKTALDLQHSNNNNGKLDIVKPYVVAIPSYRRPEILVRATLWTLFRGHIPSKRVTVFLASISERQIYKEIMHNPIESKSRVASVLPKSVSKEQVARYTKWLLGVTLVVGHKGLATQRNFITSFYPSGQHILNMDDDIRNVMRLRVARGNPRDRKYWRLEPLTHKISHSKNIGGTGGIIKSTSSLDEVIQSGFKKAMGAGAYLWGIYPVDNAYFMQPNSSTRLKFIVGPMFGIINRPELASKLDITMDEKEDMERTLRYWRQDGVIIRLNYITVQTAYYDNAGGMQASLDKPLDTRKQAAETAANRLHKMFPDLTQVFYRKSGPRKGWAEIRLKGSRPNKLTQKHPSSGVGSSIRRNVSRKFKRSRK